MTRQLCVTRLETPVTRDLTRLEHWSQWLDSDSTLMTRDSTRDSSQVTRQQLCSLFSELRRYYLKLSWKYIKVNLFLIFYLLLFNMQSLKIVYNLINQEIL